MSIFQNWCNLFFAAIYLPRRIKRCPIFKRKLVKRKLRMAQWLCLLIAFLFVSSALVQGLNKPDPDAIKSEFSVVPEETASVELQDERSPFSSLLSDIKTAGDFEASILTAHSGDSSLTSILTQNGLPIGLLPSAVESYSLSEDGKFFVSLSTACCADFDYEVYYAETITGTLSYGAISDLSGIQAKKAFLWLPVTGVRVDDSSSSYIYFNVGPFSKKLCISQFESVRVCKAKAANIRSCVENCEKAGCLNDQCFSSCKMPVNGGSSEPLKSKCPYDAWIEWDCASECRYQCMILREEKRRNDGDLPIKYYGKWPIKRVLGLQEPLSVVFSLANLAVHLQGLISFLYLLHLILPKRPQGKKGPYYEYSFLWTVYGLASLNFWLWNAVFHARDMLVTEKVGYSSAVGLLGIGLIVAIIRTFSLRIEATQVMMAAPVIAFVSTHILYLNFYNFDLGWNMQVCVTIGILQLLLWTVWAGYVGHPSRLKLWFVVIVGAMSMLLEILDFPPLGGWLDVHALRHACTVPLTWLWWSFIKEDASHRTFQLLRRTQETGELKKSQ